MKTFKKGCSRFTAQTCKSRPPKSYSFAVRLPVFIGQSHGEPQKSHRKQIHNGMQRNTEPWNIDKYQSFKNHLQRLFATVSSGEGGTRLKGLNWDVQPNRVRFSVSSRGYQVYHFVLNRARFEYPFPRQGRSQDTHTFSKSPCTPPQE